MAVEKIFLILPVFLCLLQVIGGVSRLDPLVDTKLGLIRGLRATDGDYAMFMGIPYATLNESNPFAPSKPHTGFADVFEAYDDSAICPQIEEFHNTFAGSLDCLHLNVYVPDIASSKNPLPVLVWIHGGGFSIGWSGRYLYGPKYLVQHDIILVTINYRLGPYGFMCLNTPDIPGNQGLKDQQLALQWVIENIDSFGGDSNKITLFGESAGASSVDLHFYYGKENLFNNIIMQSGSASCPWAVTEPDTTAPLILAEHLGLSTDDANEAIELLSKTDPSSVVTLSNELGLEFMPCIEQEFDGSDVFISEHPLNVKVPRARNTPILLGFNENEWLGMYVNREPEYFVGLNVFYEALENSFNFQSDELQAFEEIVRQFYIGDQEISKDTLWGISDFVSDLWFNYPATRSIQKYFENGASNVYQYMFTYVGEINFLRNKNNITEGSAVHADELGFLFDISYLTEKPTAEDQLIIDRMTTMWANFVKYGNPTPGTTDTLPVIWKPVTKETSNYLEIDSELSIKQRPFNDRMAFWNLFYKMNEKAQKGYKEL